MIEKENCPNFDNCSAALCPKDINSRRFWYIDTEVCKTGKEPWIKAQRKIQALNLNPHQYFTEKMLKSLHTVPKDIQGIDYQGYSETKEYEWFKNPNLRRKEAKENS
jgi:bisphosphoglycerate-dependent phosphoglycerate mutase